MHRVLQSDYAEDDLQDRRGSYDPDKAETSLKNRFMDIWIAFPYQEAGKSAVIRRYGQLISGMKEGIVVKAGRSDELPKVASTPDSNVSKIFWK